MFLKKLHYHICWCLRCCSLFPITCNFYYIHSCRFAGHGSQLRSKHYIMSHVIVTTYICRTNICYYCWLWYLFIYLFTYFTAGFSHRNQPTSIDLNAVRLCFQVFLEDGVPNKFTYPLTPVVSDPIYDKSKPCCCSICRTWLHLLATVWHNQRVTYWTHLVIAKFAGYSFGKLWLGDLQKEFIHTEWNFRLLYISLRFSFI